MRRYFVGPAEVDDVRSSQSLRNSESNSSQMENSQCSSFDMFSQMMSQQQVFNSQPSESSQVAQRYYTKFAAKPSLFRGSGGKEVIPADKPGLQRRRSFQDVQEYQKHKTRDKEDRDLICTLIGLLKDSTDEIKQVVGRMQVNVSKQIEAAAANTDEALNKTYQCFEDCSKKLVQEVLDKVTVMQTTSELEKCLKEKESALETLKVELDKSREDKYAKLKSMLRETWTEEQHGLCEKIEGTFFKACDGQKTEQKRSLDDFCQAVLMKIEEKLETPQKAVKESSTASKDEGFKQSAESGSIDINPGVGMTSVSAVGSSNSMIPAVQFGTSQSRVNAVPGHPNMITVPSQPSAPALSSQPKIAAYSSQQGVTALPSQPVLSNLPSHSRQIVIRNQSSMTTLPSQPIHSSITNHSQPFVPTIPISRYDAVSVSVPEMVVPYGTAIQQVGLSTQRSFASVPSTSTYYGTKMDERRANHHEHAMEFCSPPIGQQTSGSVNIPTPFSRWGTKGPSPVAAVAPRVQPTVHHQNPTRGRQATNASRSHDMRGKQPAAGSRSHDTRRGQSSSIQPPQRRSARLKQKYVESKSTMKRPPLFSSGHERPTQAPMMSHKRQHEVASGVKPKPKKAKKQYQLSSPVVQNKSWDQEVYDFTDDDEDDMEPVPFLNRSMDKRDCASSHRGSDASRDYGQTFGRPLQTYTRVVPSSRNQLEEGLQTVPQPAIGYESDDSSSDETFFSAEKQTEDVCSQDIFIDAIEEPVSSEDEDEISFSLLHRNEPKQSRKDRGHSVQQRPRGVEKKRTLWGSNSPKKTDLLSFLVSTVKKKTRVA